MFCCTCYFNIRKRNTVNKQRKERDKNTSENKNGHKRSWRIKKKRKFTVDDEEYTTIFRE